ncbi:SemiSWEET family sugar transporter [Rhodothermus marinus]|uniref:MtN3 and saliva related transmembrane protein n=1 Tax=Rhodothermus marinus (strain ATCC 43812 / DSM 4252 / R-10) TaxID=518766 RepID=D0MKH6_RHOM4|nr:SemiSWEET transporter [Rhodothermus marinus]ACY48888.1 MtN3 and saliva related transmembrane protein [Rhodothermus marinus DSM 4252]
MDLAFGIGLIAATLTTLAFLPQVVRTWRRRSADDLSAGTFLLLFTGIVLWLLYGILRRDPIIILANAVGVTLVGSLLLMIWRFRLRTRTPASERQLSEPLR